MSGRVTKSIKAFYPQYFEDAFNMDAVEGRGKNAVPSGYQVWNDMVQLIPIPTQVDSVLFKCYIEHPVVSAVGDSIKLRPAYIEAATVYTIYLVLKQLKEYSEAALYKADYKDLKADLRAKYTPKFDVLPKQ